MVGIDPVGGSGGIVLRPPDHRKDRNRLPAEGRGLMVQQEMRQVEDLEKVE